ncbi:MAG: hypothetical protein COZ65_01600, partial [Caldiserica bacterium CG_4_8_14_3_um_filter_35_18]
VFFQRVKTCPELVSGFIPLLYSSVTCALFQQVLYYISVSCKKDVRTIWRIAQIRLYSISSSLILQ